MKHTHSKNSLFLMEIILNLLLFSVLLVVGLQFFIHAHTRTEETTQLHQAVSSCASVTACHYNQQKANNLQTQPIGGY